MKQSIPFQIKKARAAANVTQAQLADIIGVAYYKVTRWENGHEEPDDATLNRIVAIGRDSETSKTNTVGWRIRVARVAAGMSQRQLAKALNTHVSTVNKIETGFQNATEEWINKIAHAVGVPPAQLTPYTTEDATTLRQIAKELRDRAAFLEMVANRLDGL